MTLLDNDKVRGYFGLETCEHVKKNDACCSGCFAKLVITAMQQPIKKGERYLDIHPFNPEPQVRSWESPNGDQTLPFHGYDLRLPDRFQPVHQSSNGGKKECQHYITCESCQSHVDIKPVPEPEKCCPRGALGNRHSDLCHKNPSSAVEEKIKECRNHYAQDVMDGDEFENHLRALVKLAQGVKGE